MSNKSKNDKDKSNKYWAVSSNIKEYNVREAFKKLSVIDWKQSNNIKSAQAGDIVFI